MGWVSLPTLRYWLRWWQDETKSAGRIENGWGREEQIARISAEIAARDAARGRNAASSRPDVAAQVKSAPDPNRDRSSDYALGAARATRNVVGGSIANRRALTNCSRSWSEGATPCASPQVGQDERQRAVDVPNECTARPPARG